MADNFDALNKKFEELLKTLDGLGAGSSRLASFTTSFKTAGKDSEKLKNLIEDMSDAAEVLGTRFQASTSSLKDLGNMLSEQIAEVTTVNKLVGRQTSMFNAVASIQRDLVTDQSGLVDLNKRDIAGKIKKLELLQQEFKFQASLAKATLQPILKERFLLNQKAKTSQGLSNKEQKRLKTLDSEAEKLGNIVDYNYKQDVAVQGTIGKLENRLGLESDISKAVGVTGALVEGTGAFMERLGMRSGIFHDAMEASAKAMRDQAKSLASQVQQREENLNKIKELEELDRKLTEEEEKELKLLKQQNKVLKEKVTFQDKLNIALKGAGILGKGFGAALRDPAVIVAAIGKGFLDVNKAAAEAQRYSGEYNSSLQGGFTTLASTKDVLETTVELTKELGVSANLVFSGEMLANAAELKNTMGLAGKELAGMILTAKTTGQSLDQVVDSTVDQVNAFNKANRSAVNHRMVLEDVGNASDSIRASVSTFPGGLAKAASSARRLGMSLSDVDSIASSLLDFESSIESELEAQLLTGKSINMAKARELALNNELGKLGDELFKNSSDIADFGKMNRIQQEAQAKALGMTRDQLARVAYMKAIENGLTDEAAAKAAGVNAENMKSMDIQEKIAKAIEKLQQAFAPILDVVVDIVDALTPVISIFGAIIGKTLGLLKTLGILKPVVGGLMAAFAAKAVINNLSDMGTKLGEITKGAKDAGKAIMGFFQEGGLQKATDSIQGYKDTFMEAFNAVKDAKEEGGIEDDVTKSLTDKVKDSVKDSVTDSVPDDADIGGSGMADKISKIDTKALLRGAAAMAFAAGAIYIFGKAVQELEKVEDYGRVAIGLGLFIGTLAATAAILYFAGPALYAGAPALIAFGAAVVLFGLGLRIATPGIEAFGTAITSMLNALTLEKMGALLLMGPALTSVAVGLAVLTASMFTAIPAIAMLGAIALMGTGLMNAGTGIKVMAEGVAKLSEALESLETSKLEEVKDLISTTALAAPAIAATGAITSLIQGIAGGGEGGSDDPVVAKIQELIDLVGAGKVVELKLDSDTIAKQQMLSLSKGK